MAGAEAAAAGAVLVVAGSTGEALPGAVSTALVVSVVDISPMVVSAALAFVVVVSVAAITDSLMISSSAATVIRGGGTGAIRTDIMVTTITRTITMDTAGIHTATTMDTADTVTTVGPVTDTTMAADQGMSGVRGVGDRPGYGSLKSPAC